jgi:RNA polymerase sigma-70 factor (ECF subfamily)
MSPERTRPRIQSPSRFPSSGERREEFETQALPHLRRLYNLALRLTRNEKDAEDLVQETYLRAFRFFHRYEPGTNIRAWLFRILKNQFLNRVQQARPAHALPGDFEAIADSQGITESAFAGAPRATPEEEVMATVTAAEVEDALAELPPEYRIVVTMALVEEMSYREIAETLRIPIGTVMSRLHRGRKALQHRLYDYVAERHLVGRKALLAAAGGGRAVSH